MTATFTLTGNLAAIFGTAVDRSVYVEATTPIIEVATDLQYVFPARTSTLDGQVQLILPANDAANDPHSPTETAFGYHITIGSKRWDVPAQATGSTHDLSEFTTLYAGPVTASVYAQTVAARDAAIAAAAGAVGVPDTTIAAVLNNSASSTRAASDALYGKKNMVYDVRDYGSLSGSDCSGVINTAAAAVLAVDPNARLFIPAGTYNITNTVKIACSLDADQATLSYTGTGTALQIGANTTGTVISRKIWSLPRVVKPSQAWDGTSIGVKIVNANDCTINVPFVQFFERGLVLYGFGQGFAYNKITLGGLWQNHKEFILDCDATGWCNQNVILGGRLQQPVSGTGATADDTTANMLLLGETTGAAPNQNTFIGTSVEGANCAFYRLDVHGSYNKFINCRWEKMTGSSRVRWNADAFYNEIQGGYDAWALTETFTAGSIGNTLRDSRYGSYIKASSVAGQSIPDSTWTTVTWDTEDDHNATYTSGTSSWIPRQGRWRIGAQVSFAGNATGTRQARLLAGGATTIDINQNPGSTTQQPVRVADNFYFNGTTSLVFQCWQSSTAPLALSTTVGFVKLSAEYLGP